MNTSTANLSQFCVGLVFCSENASVTCWETTTRECKECNLSTGIFLVFLYVLLFLAIVFYNGLIPLCFFCCERMRTKTDYIRFSLAISDMLIGLQICLVVIPSAIQAFDMTFSQQSIKVAKSINWAKADVYGSLMMMSFTSSMYHLVFLSCARLAAVLKPLWYHRQPERRFVLIALVVWLISLLSAIAPTCLPTMTYAYDDSSFLYLPIIITNVSKYTGPNFLSGFVLVFPYCLLTSLMIATIAAIRWQRKRSNAKLHRSKQSDQAYARDMKMFVTILTMHAIYTVTVVPVIIVVGMERGGVISCKHSSVPTMVTSYLSMVNSLANALVYSARDERFRKSVKGIFRKWFSKYQESSSHSNQNASNQQVQDRVRHHK